MRPFLVPLAGLLAVLASCSPPASTVPTGVDLAFGSGTSFAPTDPVAGDIITITFTVADNTTNGTAVTNVPWSLTRDGVGNYLSGNISAIAANATATSSFTLQETAGTHSYTLIINSSETVADDDLSNDSQSFTIDVLPVGST